MNEAKLITDFVERARQVEPDGILVVASHDQISDIQLQNEDVITIPERSEVVLVTGEVAGSPPRRPRSGLPAPGAA